MKKKKVNQVRHIHKYQRVDIAKTPGKSYPVFKCVLPQCSHYITPELVVGKETICWRCDEVFLLTVDLARLVRPHCKDCTRTEGANQKIKDPQILEAILHGLNLG